MRLLPELALTWSSLLVRVLTFSLYARRRQGGIGLSPQTRVGPHGHLEYVPGHIDFVPDKE